MSVAANVARRRSASVEALVAASSGRLLVVDDEPRLRESLEYILAACGYDCAGVGSGRAALDRLRDEAFDLVLLDLMLPDMTGLDVMRAIEAARIDVVVIVVSGAADIDSAIAALRAGAYDFVRKPYAAEELLRTVANALHRTRLERERRELQLKLEDSENAHRYLVDNSPDIIYMLDDDGAFSFVNDRVKTLLGYSREELLGRHYSTVVHDEDCERARYVFNERRTGERASRNVELRLKVNAAEAAYREFDNYFVTIGLNAMGVYGRCPESAARRFLGTYGVARDISERKKAEETIVFQAYHDSLTRLPNRMLFKDRLDLALAQARRCGGCLAVMFVDLDRFKLINDTLGHHRGDELLQQVAQRLQDSLRRNDTLARVGGDEFLVLLPQLERSSGAASVAQKIVDEMRLPFVLGEHELVITASVGISVFPDDGDMPELLIRNADIAMYHAKSVGKNAYHCYSIRMNEAFHEKLGLENDLRKAVERGEFVLHYQPQVDIAERRIVGMEALIRWQHPARGLVPPDRFIPLAEETGLITRISDWVIDEACRQLNAWRDAGLPAVRIAVNISAQEIEHDGFVERIVGLLERHDVDPARLELEITERVIMRDVESNAAKLQRLGDQGIMISIDDFGTRYSSLNYLRKFPIHTIKIDRSFVRDVVPDDPDTPLVAAIIAIARGFRLNVIAEGVETRHQLQALYGLDCPLMQGYLFSMPLAADQAALVLAEQRHLFSPLDAVPDLFAEPAQLAACRARRELGLVPQSCCAD